MLLCHTRSSLPGTLSSTAIDLFVLLMKMEFKPDGGTKENLVRSDNASKTTGEGQGDKSFGVNSTHRSPSRLLRTGSCPAETASVAATHSSLVEGASSSLFEDFNLQDPRKLRHGKKRKRSTFLDSSLGPSSLSSSSSSSAKSQLFHDDDLPSASILAPATLLDGSDISQHHGRHSNSIGSGSSNGTRPSTTMSTPTKQGPSDRSSSLFGAVMKKVDTGSSVMLTTPKPDAPKFAAMSPGGFQLLDFVNAVTSPFQLDRQQKREHGTENDATDSPTASVGSPVADKLDDWREIQFSANDGMQLLDWTLKRRLQFESEPSLSVPVDASILQAAKIHFLSGEKGVPIGENVNAVRWHSSLMYWQYPSASDCEILQYESIESVVGNRAGGESMSGFSNDDQSATKSQMLVEAIGDVQGDKAFKPLHEAGTKKQQTLREKQYAAFLRRKRDWQQAFVSLYHTWLQRVRKLDEELSQSEDVSKVVSQMHDVYFYATGKGHVVLFRVTISHDDDCEKSIERHNSLKISPEIVLSSTTAHSREMLRRLGAKLFLLDHWQGRKGEFTEDLMGTNDIPTASTDNLKDASPSIKAELVALRRAHVSGKTIGADVSISMKKRGSVGMSESPRRIPPLFLRGEDDCSAFFEMYFNTLGNLNTTGNESGLPVELPVLRCRKIGPFQFASLEVAQSAASRNIHQTSEEQKSSSFDVRGCLLPCAVRQLIGSACSISVEKLDAWETCNLSNSQNSSVMSRHLIARAELHDEVEAKPISGTIGMHSSKWMNGCIEDVGVAQKQWAACRHQETLSVAVWDISSRGSIAFRVSKDN